jgi:hypothetical protein
MAEILVQTFLGWPAIIASLLLAFAGIFLKKWELSFAGAMLFLPPGWYLSHYSLVFAILPMLLFGAIYAVRKGQSARAILFVIPVLAAMVALGIVVLMQ